MRPQLVNRRIRLLLLTLVLAFGGLLARAAWIQGVTAASLSRMAQSQQHEDVTIPAGRGTIYDRMGVQLALGEQATTVYADPRQIRDARRAAAVASRVLGLDPATTYDALRDRSRGFVYVARKADPSRASALAKRDLTGFNFYGEERRSYPQHTVAAQVLGFAGTDNHGLAGLELQLDHELSGRNGHQTIVKDPTGRVLNVVDDVPERQGRDAYLTLDHAIEASAEQVLRRTISRWHAKAATAVVLDPRTGGVLAMAVEPAFDANQYPAAPAEMQKNRAVTDLYEPGSTFKLVTVAGALSDRLVTPHSSFTLPYSLRVADRVVHDAELRGTERMSVSEILARSSNIGAITLAKLLGKDRLLGWIKRFGFGRSTGIDFPGESAGLLPGYWSGSTIGNVPIGQGIAVTPIQMASLYATIANGGEWVRPHLVDHIQGLRPRAPERRRVVSRLVAAQLMTMLKGVVAEGTGMSAAVPGYQVAGKTGTAQKPDGHGGYATGRYVASFVGIVPASAPKLVILVMVDEPRGGIFGGEVAAPAFQEIASSALQYLAIPPDGPPAAP
ncbi:MAG: peptidoglycan D,D-transpeptidase FtsI family protein [Gaiellaceae bacterium]